MENTKDINGIPAHPGGYDGRRIASNGGYTNAGESVAIRKEHGGIVRARS